MGTQKWYSSVRLNWSILQWKWSKYPTGLDRTLLFSAKEVFVTHKSKSFPTPVPELPDLEWKQGLQLPGSSLVELHLPSSIQQSDSIFVFKTPTFPSDRADS